MVTSKSPPLAAAALRSKPLRASWGASSTPSPYDDFLVRYASSTAAPAGATTADYLNDIGRFIYDSSCAALTPLGTGPKLDSSDGVGAGIPSNFDGPHTSATTATSHLPLSPTDTICSTFPPGTAPSSDLFDNLVADAFPQIGGFLGNDKAASHASGLHASSLHASSLHACNVELPLPPRIAPYPRQSWAAPLTITPPPLLSPLPPWTDPGTSLSALSDDNSPSLDDPALQSLSSVLANAAGDDFLFPLLEELLNETLSAAAAAATPPLPPPPLSVALSWILPTPAFIPPDLNHPLSSDLTGPDKAGEVSHKVEAGSSERPRVSGATAEGQLRKPKTAFRSKSAPINTALHHRSKSAGVKRSKNSRISSGKTGINKSAHNRKPLGNPTEDLRAKLMQQSAARGSLELDKLLGAFVENEIRAMSRAELRDYEELLQLDNFMLFSLLSAQQPEIPEELAANRALPKLLSFVNPRHPYLTLT